MPPPSRLRKQTALVPAAGGEGGVAEGEHEWVGRPRAGEPAVVHIIFVMVYGVEKKTTSYKKGHVYSDTPSSHIANYSVILYR